MSTSDQRIEHEVDAASSARPSAAGVRRRRPADVALRRNRIDRLLALVLDNADAFVDAMAADFGTRPRAGSLFTEILGMISVIEHTRSHVPQWMRATKLMRARATLRLQAEVAALPARRRRHHRAVELSAQSRGAAGFGGVRRGQPGDDQDVGDHPADRGADGEDSPRSTSTRPNSPWSPAAPDVAAAFSRAAVRPPVLHRFAVGGRAGPAGRRPEPRACDAGTRRQESRWWCPPTPTSHALGDANRAGPHDQRRPGLRLPGLRVRAR